MIFLVATLCCNVELNSNEYRLIYSLKEHMYIQEKQCV